VQILRKEITLSISERRRVVELLKLVCVRYFALDMSWLLVTEELTDKKEEEDVLEKSFQPSYQVTSGVTEGEVELIEAREKVDRRI